MAVLNFPADTSQSPYVENGISYIWDGQAWVSEGGTTIIDPEGLWVKEGNTLKPLDANDSVESDIVSYTHPGAVERILTDRLGDYVSAKDFGAVGDGTNNDLAAIQSAVNYCIDNKKALYIPAGRYNCESGVLYINHAKGQWTDADNAPPKLANGLQIVGAGIMDGISAGSDQTSGTLLVNCNVQIGLSPSDRGDDSDLESSTDAWMMDAINIGNFTVRGRLMIRTVQASSNFFNIKVLPRNSSGDNGAISSYGTNGHTFAMVCDIVSTSNFYNCLVGGGRVFDGNNLESNASGVVLKACRKVNWYGGRFNNCFRAIQVGDGLTDQEQDIVYSLSMHNIYCEKPHKEALRLAQASNCYFQVTVNGQYDGDGKEQNFHDPSTALIAVGGVTDSNGLVLPATNVRSIRIGEGRLRMGGWGGSDYSSSIAINVAESENITIGNMRYQRVGIPVKIRSTCEGYRLEGSDTFGSDTSGYDIDGDATPIQWAGVSSFETIATGEVKNYDWSTSDGGYRLRTTGSPDSSTQRSILQMQSQQNSGTSSLAFKIASSDATAFEVNYNGTSGFSAPVINLESDNPANYTIDGEGNSVYSGPTLNIKEKLNNLIDALTALRTSVAASTDVASIKSAVDASLTDF